MARGTDRPAMTTAVDLGRKATKQTKQSKIYWIPCMRKVYEWLCTTVHVIDLQPSYFLYNRKNKYSHLKQS